MKIKMLPLFLVAAANTFAFNAKADTKSIVSQISSIYCDYRYSETIYNLQNKSIKFIGRNSSDVTPMMRLQLDEQNETVTIYSVSFGSVITKTFKVRGNPYKAGFTDTYIVGLDSDECHGAIK